MKLPGAADLADLVRLPAVLSAPGDALVGAVSRETAPGTLPTVARVLASAAMYAGGMALNDVADHRVDVRERPSRPIPSGRTTVGQAAAVGEGLCAFGAVAATIAGGRRGLRRATAVVGAVHLYDFLAKRAGGSAAAASMAACRMADIAMGADRLGPALPSMAVVGAHTYAITKVSQSEVEGGDAQAPRAALVTSVGVAAAALVVGARRWSRSGRSPLAAAVALGSAATYAVPFGRAALAAMRDPSPARTGALVGAGVKGMIPLQGTLVAGAGRPLLGAMVTSQWFAARRLGRRRSVT